MVELIIVSSLIVAIVYSIIDMNYNAYKKGYEDGFIRGRTKINDHAFKINQALNERVAELQSAKNERGE